MVGVETRSFVVTLNLTVLGWGLNGIGGAGFPVWLWCAGARSLVLLGPRWMPLGGPVAKVWVW
jgi:hypothetical protein